jgi:hypothetical protein
MKNIKVATMVIEKRYVTQKDNWSDNIFSVVFKAGDYTTKKNMLTGDYTVNYKNFSITIWGSYEMGADIRSELHTELVSYMDIRRVVYGELTEEYTVIYDMLVKLLPEYKQFF